MPHSKLKFKMLASGYPRFMFPWPLLQEVGITTFCKPDTERLALFVASRAGLRPEFNFALLEGQCIAILTSNGAVGLPLRMGLYRIINGERKRLRDIPFEELDWNENEFVNFHFDHPEIKPHRRNRIPRRYRLELNNYLDKMVTQGPRASLSDAYHSAIRNIYESFVEYCYENREATWQDYLDHTGFWAEIFKLLEKCRKVVCSKEKNFPLKLEYALKLYRNIKNPYHLRSKKYFEIPESPDTLVLSDIALSIYYNNYININTVEATEIQEAIVEEFRAREYYIVNEYQLNGHANPIAIWEINGGIKKLAVNKYLPYRPDKDIVKIESGRAIEQLTYEAIYGGYNKAFDVEMVNSFNRHVGVNYWGGGRAAAIRALIAQFKKRKIDISAIRTENGFSLAHCVLLEQKKLCKINEVDKSKISHLLESYLDSLYPSLAEKGLRVLACDEKRLKFYLTTEEKCFETTCNELFQKKGTLTYLPGIKININKSKKNK